MTATLRLDAARREDILRAGEILRAGGTVAFPTETVYGLGANALSVEAVEKIFVAKQRPHWDPLIVHLAGREGLARIVRMPLDGMADRLVEAFWPGPLTLLLPRTEAVPDAVTAGRALVGVRVPAHPVARALLQAARVPVAAPSANRFGHTSPTTAQHVLDDLDGRIDAVLDGGATEVGLESTVAEVQGSEVVIYRQGAVTLGMIEAAVEPGVAYLHVAETTVQPPASLPSPGVGIRHYAPRARLILLGGLGAEALSRTRKQLELSLVDEIGVQAANSERVGVMLPDHWNGSCADAVFRWGPWHVEEVLAQRLFAGLRRLDDQGATVIVCPVPEGAGIADAIRDRLAKAAR